ncbi:S1 family peptidase [Massilia soli]|uniref:Serine protease n=1 Tax=Massilia soli TaxID=2792854 RepID=A0ABS7SJ26_9BURK|nr:serine protease [Massilia soli]MBZ2206114.1 serine protease [Massilia soli]
MIARNPIYRNAFASASALAAVLVLFCVAHTPVEAAELSRTIAAVKPSVVGIGTHQRTRTPAVRFAATGFVVGDGLSVITNAHSIPDLLDVANRETLGVVVGSGSQAQFRPATLAGLDKEHDLAHLRLSGAPLPALTIGDSATVLEGRDLAFTGFPLGMLLGLNHATHRAMLAAITPAVMPQLGSRNLNPRVLSQLQKSPFLIFQLDGTAYPGNSGSPLYDPEDGVVYGIINAVLVKGLKETAISTPSGITYAIPATYIRQLLDRKND